MNHTLIFTQVQVDMSGYNSACQVNVQLQGEMLSATWATSANQIVRIVLDLRPGLPLFNSMSMSLEGSSTLRTITQNINPRFDVTIGTQTKTLVPYIFFDYVDTRPYTRYEADLSITRVTVTSSGRRVSISLSGLSAGSFSGDLVIHLYSGSPLIHMEAAMTTMAPWAAYIYDALLSGTFSTICYKDNTDQFRRITPQGELSAKKVRNRTIISEFSRGSIAVFPPPHAYIFPTDYSVNQGFVQAGAGLFGTRQSPLGDEGFRPWINTLPGRKQHMGVFLLLSTARGEETLERVKQYTHNDTFKEVPGYITMTHHYHPEITLGYKDGRPTGPDFVAGMKAMNVKMAQILEFHIGGALNDTGTARLEEMHLMFELCEEYSDSTFTLIPGEEPNVHLGDTHWAYIFPHRVYYTQQRDTNQPFTETVAPFGTVYHLGSEADVYEMLKRENGVGLTSHPRIKSSRFAPDNMAYKEIIKDDNIWFGGDWKAMPMDLSYPRPGYRSFGLLDDFNQRGYKKKIIGEVDTFELHPEDEIYAHMNMNYLKLSSHPTARDWSRAFEVIKNGDFYTTTGEVLIYSFSADTQNVSVDLEWTFPLSFAEIISGDGLTINRHSILLPQTTEFGRQSFSWNVDLSGANWVRFEAWDVARNGVFTQTIWLKDPVHHDALINNFTLMDADNDLPIAGFDPIPDNATIDLSALHTRNLNIRANTNPWIVGSVMFGYDDNPGYQYESAWPYPLAGNEAGYNAWTPTEGTHTVTATPSSDVETGIPLSVTFTVIDNLLNGDVNRDNSIDIVDALLIAQYYVGLNPAGFTVSAGDVNCDDAVDVVDALLIARYYVGLVMSFCEIGGEM